MREILACRMPTTPIPSIWGHRAGNPVTNPEGAQFIEMPQGSSWRASGHTGAIFD
jgi:hypothetical protein